MMHARTSQKKSTTSPARPFFSHASDHGSQETAFFTPEANSPAVQAKQANPEGKGEEKNPRVDDCRSSDALQHTGGASPLPPPDGTPGPVIQAKLTVGAADDPLEREAESVADQILRAPEPTIGGIAGNGGGGTDGENSNHNGFIQAKNNQCQSRRPQLDGKPSSASATLPDSVREYMETRFGYDFSGVNIHVDSDVAPRLNARAFTVGSHIHFGPGEFKPNTHDGKRIIGHELTHTVQQGAVPALGEGRSDSRLISRISRTPVAIQREVGLDLVESSANVLSRIESRIAQADAHTDIIVRVARALVAAFPDLNIPPNLRRVIENEPLFRAGVGNLVRLIELALEFNPGAGRDSPLNRFVYTCNCGWIDMGHFFFSAVPAYAAGLLPHISNTVRQQLAGMSPSEVALVLGWFMEYLQEAFRQFYTGPFGSILNRAPNSVREAVMGNVRSAFTVEDLPSDAFGAGVGQEVWRDFAGNFSPFSLFEPEAFDIHDKMTEFFSDCRAVFPTGQTRRTMVEETLGHPVDRRGILPRQHFSTSPLILTTAFGLCPVPETACPPVDERGWEQSHPAGRVDESTDRTTLWNFGVNLAALKSEHEARLRQAAAALPSGVMIMVEGFASCTGSSSLNERLARSRAEAAVAFLKRLRPDLRIGMNYFGERTPNPSVSPGDGEAMARNRRVEIHVINVPRTQAGLPAFQLPGQTTLPAPAVRSGQAPQIPVNP